MYVGVAGQKVEERFTPEEAYDRIKSIVTDKGKVPPPAATTMKEGETRTVLATCYYAVSESAYSGEKTQPVKNAQGAILTKVSESFLHHLTIEGSGILSDGRVLGVQDFPKNLPNVHNQTLSDWLKYTFAFAGEPRGKYGPVYSMKSLAVDPTVIAPGSTVLIQESQGKTFTYYDLDSKQKNMAHDGIWYAKDIGGSIQGNHIDMFIGVGLGAWKKNIPICGKNLTITIKKRGV